MINYFFNKSIYTLLIVFIFFTFCNGQVKSNSNTDHAIQTTKNDDSHPKLVKTQGSKKGDNVWCGMQDKANNLWFGTFGEGVYRYDGKLFTQFTVKDGLLSNSVLSILEDKEGNIWFGTSNGICRFDVRLMDNSVSNRDGQRKKIVPVSIPFSIRPILNNNNFYNNQSSKNSVWSMLQDKSGKLWFGTGDGVYCYNGSNFTRFLNFDGVINKDNLQLKMVDCMLEDKKGNIWFASGCPPGMEGVCCYDGNSITSFKPKGDGWIRNIIEDKNGTLFLVTRHNGVLTYDGKNYTNCVMPKKLNNDLLTTVFIDQHKNIWYASDYINDSDFTIGGVWKSDGKSFVEFTKMDGLTNTSVSFIMEDKAGNIWLGTRNIGLYKYDARLNKNPNSDQTGKGKIFTRFSE